MSAGKSVSSFRAPQAGSETFEQARSAVSGDGTRRSRVAPLHFPDIGRIVAPALVLAILLAAFAWALAIIAPAEGKEPDWISRFIDPNQGVGQRDFRLPVHGICDRNAVEGGSPVAAGASLNANMSSTAASLGSIGRTMDRIDLLCIAETLDHAEDGYSIMWANPSADAAYLVTPVRSFREAKDQMCRDYALKAFVGDTVMETYRTACRLPGGEWEPAIRNFSPEAPPQSTSG